MTPEHGKPSVDAAYARFLGLALASIVVAVAAVIGSAVYVYGAFGKVAAEISGDAIPSMLVLADARSELREVQTGLEEVLDVLDADVSRQQSVVTAALHRLADDLEQYRALPLSAGEAELWPELAAGEAEVAAVAARILGIQRAAEPRSPALERTLRRSAQQLDAALARTIRVNGAAAKDVGEMANAVRRTALPVTLALSVLGLMIAVGAIAMAGHLVRNALHHERLATDRERDLRVELERRARELEAFSGSVAHDLLSPLMTVALALNLAEQRLPPAEKERTGNALAAAERSLSGVRQLVDGLLRFARASARPRPEDRADACEIVRDVVDDHLALAGRAGVELDVAACSPAVVGCSPGVLISITGNLIRNAVKALADSPVRRIRVRVAPEPPMVRFEVEDTGPGIEASLHVEIFEPHVRGPHGGRSGFGLGLATVKRLVESSGGQVGLVSEPGKGALFWFTLPLATRAEAGRGAAPDEPPAHPPAG